MPSVRPLRVLVKTILLFLAVDLLFGLFDPPVQKLSLYNSIFPGQLRFPFGTEISGGQLAVNELDALFAAHVISARPTSEDELHVVVLGNSSVWGFYLSARQTLPERLDAAGLTCGGRRIRVYNLGYPQSSSLKDLAILQRAMQYKPDAILWIVTLNSFLFKKSELPFLRSNAAQITSIVRKYQLPFDLSLLQSPTPSLWDRSLLGQRNRLVGLFLSQWYGVYWAAGIEPTVGPEAIGPIHNDLTNDLKIDGVEPKQRLSEIVTLETLEAGRAMAGNVPILLVNQPIFIATGANSNIRYNDYYPRSAYDEYRQLMEARARQSAWNYMDLWNAIPDTLFLDTPLHLSEQGEAVFSQLLAPRLLQAVCTAAP